MKIFDRYIIQNFLKNYFLSFIVLVGLYVTLDMVFHFDDLARSATMPGGGQENAPSGVSTIFTVLGNIVDFYLYQPSVFFVQLSGIIPVVAAAFTLVRMTRFNELTAMLAAGVPMLRIAAPIIVVGIALNALLVIDQELIIPRITHKLVREHDEVGSVRGTSFPITAMEDGNGSLLIAAEYFPVGANKEDAALPAYMDRVDIVEFHDQHPIAHIQAKTATFDPKHSDANRKVWILDGGIRQTGLQPDDPIGSAPLAEWVTDIGPDEVTLYRRASYVDFLSTAQINNLLEHPRNFGTVPLLRVKHWRFVQPIANIVLLLLAIPCVLTREPGALKRAATRTVLLTGACMAVMFVANQVAGRPPFPGWATVWPAIAVWIPVFIFAPIAVWQMDHVKS